MRRRDVIAGLAGLATVGGGLSLLAAGSGGRGVEPAELETVEAPGSPAGTVSVPARGRVSLVTFFATWCHVCEAEMTALASVAERRDESVQQVSVTNEPVGHSVTRTAVRDWWREHGGSWPVALDADLALTEAMEVSGVPTLVVLDADNVVTWRHTGRAAAATLLDELAAARDPTTGEPELEAV
ncbi:MAG: TlpA disulfide reductase family protein [Halobacteriales archaeon]